MKKRRLFILIVLAAVMVLACAPASPAGNLSDIQEAAWAQQDIGEMNTLGIIVGYPDGLFRPYKEVTMLEVVVMLVRTLGLEEHAKSLENTSVNYSMPPGLSWGRGYLIEAVQLGMLDKDNLYQFEPDAPASRLEVTLLVYYALSLSEDSRTLDFADADQIPWEYHDRVSAVVRNNIMQGYPGNLFMPYDYQNRAQTAVLLARLVNNGFTNPYPDRVLKGNITSRDLSSQTITIKSIGTMTFTSDCFFFRGGTRINTSDLWIGDEVRLFLNSSNRVACITVLGHNTSTTLEGEIRDLDTSGSYGITIWDDEEDVIYYDVDEDVEVILDGDSIDFDELNIGDKITFELTDNGVINYIEVAEKSYSDDLEGEIRALDTTGTWGITIRKDNGERKKYAVDSKVDVWRDGGWIDFDELKAGELVRLELNRRDRVVEIEVIESSENEGEIRALDTTGTWGITIRKDNGERKKYAVDSKVDVWRDGDWIDFDELKKGERVWLELNSRDRVVEIEVIEEVEEISGTVTDLDTGSTPEIEIEDDDGDRFSYDISDDAEFEKDGDDINLDEIVIGSEVEIEIEGGEAVRIEVTNDQDITIKGEVTSVSTSRKRIRIKQSNGGEFYYYFVDNPRLKDRSGDNIELSDVRVGWDVRLNLKDGKIYRLTRL